MNRPKSSSLSWPVWVVFNGARHWLHMSQCHRGVGLDKSGPVKVWMDLSSTHTQQCQCQCGWWRRYNWLGNQLTSRKPGKQGTGIEASQHGEEVTQIPSVNHSFTPLGHSPWALCVYRLYFPTTAHTLILKWRPACHTQRGFIDIPAVSNRHAR